ncbi:MAG: phage major capsid protein [Planctomycetota bacterium]
MPEPKDLPNSVQQALDEVRELLEGACTQKQFDDAMTKLRGEAADTVTLKGIDDAVKKLETDFEAMAKDKQRLVAVKGLQAFGDGGRYRGVFAHEDDARAFGLGVMARAGTDQQRQRALEVLDAEHADARDAWGFEQRAPFTTTDADPAIPEGFNNTLVRLVEDYGTFEREALPYPMPEAKVRFPKRAGGLEAKPLAEATASDEQNVSLTPNTLDVDKWGVHTFFSREAEEDSAIGIAELNATEMALGFAVAVDKAGYTGDGTATFSGITGVVNALGAGGIVPASGNSWAGITEDDINRLISTLPDYPGARPKFHTTRQFFWQVMEPILAATGGRTMTEAQGRVQLQYKGFDVVINRVMPKASAASQIPLLFGDLRQAAAIGTRRQMEIRRSEHFRFLEDLITLQSLRRFDILVHSAGDADDPEAVVGLQTAA